MISQGPGEIEKGLKASNEKWVRSEEEGVKNVLKHFDRIHDKLFTANNILIAGYFVLAKFESDVPLWTILIPFVNLAFLIILEIKMMGKSRFESEIRKKSKSEIEKWGNKITYITFYSFCIILTTFIVACIFLWLFLR